MGKQFFNYLGAIHIHTKLSDGTGDINSISKAAKKAGLNWIIITDHNNFDIEEGFYNGVCVIKGEEISPCKSNHYIALGIKNLINPSDDTQKFVDEVRAQGGFGFAAHPDEADNRKNKAHPIKWTDKSVIPDGIEIWNWFSDWADDYDESNIFKIAYSYFFRHKLIQGPHKETLKWWDELNKNSEHIIPAITGVDAHALKISKYIIPIKIFPYKDCFKTLVNIIPLENKPPEDFEEQKNLILSSIKNGNNIMINRHVKKDIPLIYVEDKSIIIKLSTKAQIKIIQNGTPIHSEINNNLKFPIQEKTKYRVEVYLKNQPWIFSNQISIK